MKTKVATVAQMIRKKLKSTFPKIKFSVTSENYSGGNAINISYTDRLNPSEIEKITNKYLDGRFESMDDSYEYRSNPNNEPRAGYIFVRRELPIEYIEELKTKYEKIYGEKMGVITPYGSIEGYSSIFCDCFDTVIYKFANGTIGGAI